MKKNYISDLRYSEKIKESQTFMTVDGLQKKIRKKQKNNPHFTFDAEKIQRQIMCFWKEGWDYQHYHPVFLNPKVYYPIVTISDPQQQTSEQLKKYANTIKMLIQRLRTDNQIQVNYKIQQRNYITNWQDVQKTDKKWKFHGVAQKSIKNLLQCLFSVTKEMIASVSQSQQLAQNVQFLQSQDINNIAQIKKQLMYVNRVLQRHLSQQQGMQQEMQIQEEQKYRLQAIVKKCKEQTRNLQIFTANVVSVLDQMKQQTNGPSFISVQPKIGQLTYIVHPILIAINGLFYKQKVHRQQVSKVMRKFEQQLLYNQPQQKTPKQLDQTQFKRKMIQSQEWDKIKLQSNHLLQIKDNLKQQNQIHSKIVFINFDGYQSEYNLQLARNFTENLMYLSFPKFSKNNQKSIKAYENRFYKKIMFEKTKPGEIISQNEELQLYFQQQRLTKNPEKYHQNIQKLYKQKNQQQQNALKFMGNIDRNQKLYIFPISMSSLLHNHHQKFPQHYQYNSQNQTQKPIKQSYSSDPYEKQSTQKSQQSENMCDVVQNYESYFIRFLFRRFLFNQIQKFGPTHIIISYSNRITLEDNHFVEIIQELTKIGRYKIMMFPNFTTSYINQLSNQMKSEMNQHQQEEEYPCCYSINNARLIIGNNNMTYRDNELNSQCYDQCPLTLSFFSKVLRFLKITSGNYNLQQNHENQSLSSKLKNIKIYPYAQFLFNILSEQYSHLTNKIDKDMLKADKFFLQQRLKQQSEDLKKCIPKFYKKLLNHLQKLIVQGIESPPYEQDINRVLQTLIKDFDNDQVQRIRKYQIQLIKVPFEQFRLNQQRQKIDNKYQQKLHLYFKTKTQREQFKQANEEKINSKTKPGLHLVTLGLTKQKTLPVYKDTSLVFQTNQIGKDEAYLLVMNHMGLNDDKVNHYITKVKLNNKTSFQNQICLVDEIVFLQGQKLEEIDEFKAKCQWNFKQTKDYLLLYWPSQYDFVKASLFKMSKQQYEPRICDQIYIAHKSHFNKFYRVRILLQNPIIPRRGCSAYDFDNKVFIFGGLYERQFNYLKQQNDIVTIDLNQLNIESSTIPLRSLKSQLYSKEYFDSVVQDHSVTRKINSVIRPKIQIQFYDCQDICTNQLIGVLSNETTKSVIMIGGYGQNFLSPHSLLTYFYHIIKFNTVTRQIISIQKRNSIQKSIPINIQQLIKNKHIFQNFNIFQNQNITKGGFTKQNHYFFHRVTYSLLKMENKANDPYMNDVYDLNFKFLYLYATEMYNEVEKNYLKFAQKIGEKRIIQETEGSKVQIINNCNNNILVTNEEGSYLYSLYLKLQIGRPPIPLTNQSILSLDTNNNMVCALIKHKQYTSQKCILAVEKIQLPNPKYSYFNEQNFINLMQYHQFQDCFDLHVLFMMKRNQIIIVHGNSFEQYDVFDRVISTKYTRAENLGEIVGQKSPYLETNKISLKMFYDCTSFFIRINQRLVCANFMTHQSKQLEFVYTYDRNVLDMNSAKKEWKSEGGVKYLSFLIKTQTQQIYLGKIKFLQIIKKSNVQNYCFITPCFPAQMATKKYYFVIQNIQNQTSFNFKQMKVHKIKVKQSSEMEKSLALAWKKVYKNQQRYQDSNIPIKKG